MKYQVLGKTSDINLNDEPWMRKLQNGTVDPIRARTGIYGYIKMDPENPFRIVDSLMTKIDDASRDAMKNSSLKLSYKWATPGSKSKAHNIFEKLANSERICLPEYSEGLYKEEIAHMPVAHATIYALCNINRFDSINEFNDYIEKYVHFNTTQINKPVEDLEVNHPNQYQSIIAKYASMENYIRLLKESYEILFEFFQQRKDRKVHPEIISLFDERFIMRNDLYLRLYCVYKQYDQSPGADHQKNGDLLTDLFPHNNNKISPLHYYSLDRPDIQKELDINIQVIECDRKREENVYHVFSTSAADQSALANSNTFCILRLVYLFDNGKTFYAYLPVLTNQIAPDELF